MYLHKEKGKVSMCAPSLSNRFWEPKRTLRQAQSLKSKSSETEMGGASCVKMCSSILPYKAVVSFYAESTSVGIIEIWALLITLSCPPPQFCYELYHRSGPSCSPEWVIKWVFLDNSYSYSANIVVNMHSWRIRNKDVIGYLLLLLTAHCIMGYVVILTNIISTIAKHFFTFNVMSPILKVQQVGLVRLI